jgi:glucose dehydrogenase
MAARVWRITRFDDSTYEVIVGTGDHATSYLKQPSLPDEVRWSHTLYCAASRSGHFTGTFEEFLADFADLDAVESGESTAPLAP